MNLLVVMAHPDDESMGNGGMICRHTQAGVDVHLICATRGGAGWTGKPAGRRPDELPEIRAQELERAAALLGIRSLELWDYPDGDVSSSDQDEITHLIAAEVQRHRPEVVVGWGPDGGYGHPDHIAVGACTDRALADFRGAHYHMAIDRPTEAAYRRAFDLVGEDGGGLPLVGFDELSVTFILNEDELATKASAIACHESQVEAWREQMDSRPEVRRGVLGHDSYRRVGGPFEGIRETIGTFPELARIGGGE
ncbi:MAG TPA: PIG-L family deacetylase [Candidatus Dormibacteraeota bacterium]